jgi:hypothetical protein
VGENGEKNQNSARANQVRAKRESTKRPVDNDTVPRILVDKQDIYHVNKG